MKRIITPIVLGATALTLSACGGGSSSHASSGAKAAASNIKSAASSSPSSTTATSPSSSSPTSAALIDDATLKRYAEKLGCTNPDVKTARTAKAKALGLASMIDCSSSTMSYILIRTNASDKMDAAVKTVFSQDNDSHGFPYVQGANWIVMGDESKDDAKPTMPEAQEIQKKLGGEIKTLP